MRPARFKPGPPCFEFQETQKYGGRRLRLTLVGTNGKTEETVAIAGGNEVWTLITETGG